MSGVEAEKFSTDAKNNPLKAYKLYKEQVEGKGEHCIFCNICNKCCCCKCEAEAFGMEYCSRFGGVGSGIYKNYGYFSAKTASVFVKMSVEIVDNCQHCEHKIDDHVYVVHPDGKEYVNL